MTTQEIIKIYKMQSSKCDNSREWFESISVKIERCHLIQVLKDTRHCNHITNDLDSWFELNTWSDLIDMVDCALELDDI